jgi:hypothetical protein
MSGNLFGGQVSGHAVLLDAAQTKHYRRLLGRKYAVSGRLLLLGSRIRRGTAGSVGIRITLS